MSKNEYSIETTSYEYLVVSFPLMSPLMSQLSMIYLLAPASNSDVVERLFSVAGRICRPHRSILNPDTISLLVTLKYRMNAEKRAIASVAKDVEKPM